MFLACGVALALPSEPDQTTPMVNGTVRTIQHVGTNIWVGGKFTQVKQCSNRTKALNVSNLAVFDSETNSCKNFAVLSQLVGTGSEVWDMMKYGGTGQFKDDVLIAGKFSGSSSTQKNLVRVDGTTGAVKQWYNSPSLKSVLAAPNLDARGGEGRVYGGGVSLTAFDTMTGEKVWTDGSRAKTTVENALYPDAPSPGYRDLELDGQTIWAACACDAVGGNAAKSLVKLSTEGAHATSWQAEVDHASWGMSVVKATDGALYLGAGGSDYLAKFSKPDGGTEIAEKPTWVRDTSGSVQVVEEMGEQLVIGGHFWEVSDKLVDQPPVVDMVDKCGHGRPGDVDQDGIPTLDPNGKCETRKGIAAYSFEGKLDPWSPTYAGKYSLVWALHVDGTRLHTGGEFLTVNGVTRNYYARLS